jgi:hypothetical protein
MSDTPDSRDLPRMLLGLMGVEPCAPFANVADQVWIDHAALCRLDRCVCELVARHAGPQDFQHAAYVLDDGGLVVFGWSLVGGYFGFRVERAAWGWALRPS